MEMHAIDRLRIPLLQPLTYQICKAVQEWTKWETLAASVLFFENGIGSLNPIVGGWVANTDTLVPRIILG